MKRKLLALILVVMLLVGALTSCSFDDVKAVVRDVVGDEIYLGMAHGYHDIKDSIESIFNPDADEEGDHTHTYATEWSKDDTNHWHAATCEHKGEKKDLAAHTYTNGACVCGQAEPAAPHEHTYATEWSNDETNHWHAATCEHTNEKKDLAAHTYTDGVCVCGKTEPVAPHEHTYAAEWSYDDTTHWHAATCEHTDLKADEATHAYVDGTCACGKTEPVAPHEHTYATEWSSNDTHHWHAATCEHTEQLGDYAEHDYENGVCICGKNEPVDNTPDGSEAKPYPITIPGTINVDYPTDSDNIWYSFTAEETCQIKLTFSSTNYYLTAKVNGQVVSTIDGSSGEGTSEAKFPIEAGVTYLVGFTSADGQAANFSVSVAKYNPEDDEAYKTVIYTGSNTLIFSDAEIAAGTADRKVVITEAGEYAFGGQAQVTLFITGMVDSEGNTVEKNESFNFDLVPGEYTATISMTFPQTLAADTEYPLTVTNKSAQSGGEEPEDPAIDITGTYTGTYGEGMTASTLTVVIGEDTIVFTVEGMYPSSDTFTYAIVDGAVVLYNSDNETVTAPTAAITLTDGVVTAAIYGYNEYALTEGQGGEGGEGGGTTSPEGSQNNPILLDTLPTESIVHVGPHDVYYVYTVTEDCTIIISSETGDMCDPTYASDYVYDYTNNIFYIYAKAGETVNINLYTYNEDETVEHSYAFSTAPYAVEGEFARPYDFYADGTFTCAYPGGNDIEKFIWYKADIYENGTFVINFTDRVNAKYSIDGGETFVSITDATTQVEVATGTSIYLGIQSFRLDAAEIPFTTEWIAAPGTQANPLAIESTPYNGEITLGYYESYYYGFTASANGHVTVTVTGASEGNVYINGTEGNTLTFAVIAGNKYTIQVLSVAEAASTYSVAVSFEEGELTAEDYKALITDKYANDADYNWAISFSKSESGVYYATVQDGSWTSVYYYDYSVVFNADGTVSVTLLATIDPPSIGDQIIGDEYVLDNGYTVLLTPNQWGGYVLSFVGEGGETPDPEPEEPTGDYITVTITDNNTFVDQLFSFTADEAGTYTFTVPSGYGWSSKAAYDSYAAPEIDPYAGGGTIVLTLAAGETYWFYYQAPTKGDHTISYTFTAGEVEGGGDEGGDDPATETELIIGNNSVNAEDVTFAYTATEAGALTLTTGASIMGGDVQITYAINGGAANALALSSSVELPLAAGDKVVITVIADGDYTTITAVWAANGGGSSPESNQLVLGDNTITVTEDDRTAGAIDYTLVVENEGTYSFASNYLMAVINFADGSTQRGSAYLTAGTYTISVVTAYTSAAGDYVMTVTYTAPEGGDDTTEPDGTQDNPYEVTLPATGLAACGDSSQMTWYTFTVAEDGTLTVTYSNANSWFYLSGGSYNNESGSNAQTFTYAVTANTTYVIGLGVWDAEEGVTVDLTFTAGAAGGDQGGDTTECTHSWAEVWYHEDKVWPTCTTGGVNVYCCDNCGEYKTEACDPDPTAHDYVTNMETYKAATCLEDGYNEKTCSLCGDHVETVLDKEVYGYHDWVTDQETYKAPTCQTAGYDHQVCSVCNAEQTLEEPANSWYHVNEYSSNYSIITCSVCGNVTIDAYIDATETSYGVQFTNMWDGTPYIRIWNIENLSDSYTFTMTLVDGAYVLTLTNMNETANLGEITAATVTPAYGGIYVAITFADETTLEVNNDTHEHDYQSTVVAPNCTEQGYTSYACVCGQSYIDENSYVDALGHTWVDATDDVAKHCSVCWLEEIVKTTNFTRLSSSDKTAASSPNCMEYVDGEKIVWSNGKTGEVTVTVLKGTASGVNNNASAGQFSVGNTITFRASGNKITKVLMLIDGATGSKDADGNVTGPANTNPNAKGSYNIYLAYKDGTLVSDPNVSVSYNYETVSSGASLVFTFAEPVEEFTFTVPNKNNARFYSYYATTYYLKNHEHTVVDDAAVEATCTESGLTAGSHCSVCNDVLVAQEPIEALGHTEVADAAVGATCTENGLTAGSHCSVCNDVLVAQETIAATGEHIVEGNACSYGCGYTVAAKVGEQYYQSFAAAVAAGGDVLLVGNVTLDAANCVVINDAAANVNINLNGYTITMSESLTSYPFEVIAGSLTITNGKIAAAADMVNGNYAYSATFCEWPDANVTLEGVEFVVAADYGMLVDGETSIKDSTIDSVDQAFYLNNVGNTVTLEGVTVNADTYVFRIEDAYAGTQTLVIKSGTYTSGVVIFGIDYCYGNATVSEIVVEGGEFNAPVIFRFENANTTSAKITIKGGTFNGVDYTAVTDWTELAKSFTGDVAGVDVQPYVTVAEDGTVTIVFHTHEYESAVTAPTCTVAGYTTYTCACGNTYTDDAVAATGEHTGYDADYVCDVCSGVIEPAADSVLTLAQANALGVAMAHNTYTANKYYITVQITSVYNATYGNMNVKDAEGNTFTLYGTYDADGTNSYKNMTVKPVMYDTITVYGVIGQYSGTAQMKNGWITEHIVHECSEYSEATCKQLATCVVCGATTGELAEHVYVDGVCSVCGHEEGAAAPTYKQVTSSDEFTSGTYIIVVSGGQALSALDGSWVTVTTPVVEDGAVASFDASAVWTVTVDGSSVTLTDANGVSIAPKSGNNNGIQSGSYSWAWTWNEDGTVCFKGVGSDTTILAYNKTSEGFRAYKNTTVSGNPTSYPSTFTLYKLV